MDGPAITLMIHPGLWRPKIIYLAVYINMYSPCWTWYGMSITQMVSRGMSKGTLKCLVTRQDSFRVVGNKAGRFSLIAESVHAMAVPDGKEVVSTAGNKVVCQPDRARGACSHVCPYSRYGPSWQQPYHDSNNRLWCHCHRHICYETPDIWRTSGTLDSLRHWIIVQIHPSTSSPPDGGAPALGLLTFHSLSRYDIVCAFYGNGKKTLIKAIPWSHLFLSRTNWSPPWGSYDDPRRHHGSPRTVARPYHLDTTNVEATRFDVFCYKSLDFDHQPPWSDALWLHIRHGMYQGGHIYSVIASQVGNLQLRYKQKALFWICVSTNLLLTWWFN